MNNREVILHCHIFKNAGTTLDWALARSFKQGFYDHRDDKQMRRSGIKYLDCFLHNNPSVVALSSHHLPFMPEHTEHYWWLVLLREPVRRVRSVFEFEVKQPISSLGSKMAKTMTFSDYIKWRMQDNVPGVINNFHVRYLNNITKPGNVVDDSFVDRVLQRLSLSNVLVGTVEQFEASMVLFEESLNEYFPEIDLSFVRQNVGRKDPDSPLGFLEELTSETRELVYANNQLDKKLHEAVSIEQQKVIRGIPDFEHRLEEFNVRCKALAKDNDGYK